MVESEIRLYFRNRGPKKHLIRISCSILSAKLILAALSPKSGVLGLIRNPTQYQKQQSENLFLSFVQFFKPNQFAHFGSEIRIFGINTDTNRKSNAIFDISDPENSYIDTLFNSSSQVTFVHFGSEIWTLGLKSELSQKYDVIF